MKEKLVNLLGVRSIITICLTLVLCYGFIVGKVEAKDFLVYVTMVFTFFFAKTDREKVEADKEKAEEKVQELQTKLDKSVKGVG